MTTTIRKKNRAEKRFKKYERLYKDDIRYLHKGLQLRLEASPVAVSTMKKWPWEVKRWTRAQVEYAVYEANDHISWQIFRSALKGFSTTEKLVLMINYCLDLKSKEDASSGQYSEVIQMTRVRIDNYLGALVRGGLLDGEHNVIKE